MEILVVGATGALGGEICRRAIAAGHSVRGLARESSDPDRVSALREAGVEIVLGDLKDPPSISKALDGVSAVVSSATSVHARRDRDDFETVDGRGQLDLVDAAAEAGVERFVYVSYSGGITTEQPLGWAKRAAEERLRSKRLSHTILRPTFFSEIWLGPRLCIDVESGTAQIFGSGEAPVSWISLLDVAEFAARSLALDEARNETIELGGPEALSQLDAVEIFQEETGRTLRAQHVPEKVLEDALESAEHDLAQTFAGLKLAVARGDQVPMTATAETFDIPLRTVRDHARSAALRALALASLMTAACGAADGPPDSPGAGDGAAPATPERAVVASSLVAADVFAPGSISSEGANETWITLPADGREAIFSRYDADFDYQTLFVSRLTDAGWSAAEPASFSGRWSDRAAYFAPDGRLFFSSKRPLAGGGASDRWRIWVVERAGDAWGEPLPLPESVNAVGDYHPAVASDGTLYWASAERPEGLGRSDIYAASRVGETYGPARHLEPPINSELSEPDLYIDPERRFMVLAVTERDGGRGGDDLWVSRREGTGWTEPVNLGDAVNGPEYEYGPYIHGEWLYFTSHRSGQADIHRVPVADVPVLADASG